MKYKIALHTDVGTQKKNNQDSVCIRQAVTAAGTITMVVMCDGMGGLEKGEVASATLITAFAEWFETELPQYLTQVNPADEVRYRWGRIIRERNQAIAAYGRDQGIQLGSTITAMIIFENGKYLIVHVGDTRAYRITDTALQQLTMDQTLVAREVRMGRMTPEQAAADPRRNVLLQCVGASRIVEPDFIEGMVEQGACYMLCSDGFRHVVTEEEICAALAPAVSMSEPAMKENLIRLTEMNKQRGETDNITAVLLKVE